MQKDLEQNPSDIIDPSSYLGRDLRQLDEEEFEKLRSQYSTYHSGGFTDIQLGEHLGQMILALNIRKNQVSEGDPNGIKALEEPWLFNDPNAESK